MIAVALGQTSMVREAFIAGAAVSITIAVASTVAEQLALRHVATVAVV